MVIVINGVGVKSNENSKVMNVTSYVMNNAFDLIVMYCRPQMGPPKITNFT